MDKATYFEPPGGEASEIEVAAIELIAPPSGLDGMLEVRDQLMMELVQATMIPLHVWLGLKL